MSHFHFCSFIDHVAQLRSSHIKQYANFIGYIRPLSQSNRPCHSIRDINTFHFISCQLLQVFGSLIPVYQLNFLKHFNFIIGCCKMGKKSAYVLIYVKHNYMQRN